MYACIAAQMQMTMSTYKKRCKVTSSKQKNSKQNGDKENLMQQISNPSRCTKIREMLQLWRITARVKFYSFTISVGNFAQSPWYSSSFWMTVQDVQRYTGQFHAFLEVGFWSRSIFPMKLWLHLSLDLSTGFCEPFAVSLLKLHFMRNVDAHLINAFCQYLTYAINAKM